MPCENHGLTHTCPPMPISAPPMEPPGTHIIAHEKPDQRAFWDYHGVAGYYLGSAMDHYGYYQVHITKTRGTWIIDTVEFSPSKTAMSQTSSNGLTTIAALKLSNAPMKPAPVASFGHIGTAQLHGLHQLSEFFTAALPPMEPQHSPPTSQASSQFRNTTPPAPVPVLGSLGPETPSP
jgi:hypothetical protein